MSNTIEKDRDVALGMLKFIGTSVTVIAATVGIFSFITKARSLEPTYVYTIPTTITTKLSGPTLTHASVPESSIILTNIEYYDDDGFIISEFVNIGYTPERAELQLLINGKISKSKTSTLNPGEFERIFTTVLPNSFRDINPTAIVTSLPPSPGSISYAY